MIKRCMYMCAACLLVLPSVFFMVGPFASATEAVPLYIKWNYSNSQNSGYLENPINRSVTDALAFTQAYSFWKMQGMRFYNYTEPCDIYIEFDIAALCATDPFTSGGTQAFNLFGLNIDGTKGMTISNAGEGTSAFITYLSPNGYITNTPEFHDLYPIPSGRTILLHVHSEGNETLNYIDLDFVNVPLLFTTIYNSQRLPIIPYITNIRVFNDLSSLLLDNLDQLEDIAAALDIVKSVNQQTLGYVHNIRDSVAMLYSIEYSLYNSNWNYTTFEYDNNGDLTTTTSTGSWYEALLGTLQNLSGDAQRQAEEEQKAKDAGLDDALDDAYDRASGSLIGDFVDIGDMAPDDPDDLASAGSVISHWFSQQTYDSLHNLGNGNRDISCTEPEVVDFYSSNLEEILSIFGGDE